MTPTHAFRPSHASLSMVHPITQSTAAIRFLGGCCPQRVTATDQLGTHSRAAHVYRHQCPLRTRARVTNGPSLRIPMVNAVAES